MQYNSENIRCNGKLLCTCPNMSVFLIRPPCLYSSVSSDIFAINYSIFIRYSIFFMSKHNISHSKEIRKVKVISI